MKKILQASLSAVLVLSLAGCKSTAASVSSTQSAKTTLSIKKLLMHM